MQVTFSAPSYFLKWWEEDTPGRDAMKVFYDILLLVLFSFDYIEFGTENAIISDNFY